MIHGVILTVTVKENLSKHPHPRVPQAQRTIYSALIIVIMLMRAAFYAVNHQQLNKVIAMP